MSASLPIRSVAKPWGRNELPAPFAAPDGERIGEIWFEPPAELGQLLVKYIFTSEALSVQVHPSDAQTLAKGLGRQGKEECWLVIDAEPGAVLGIGFERPVNAATIRSSARDGSIEKLLKWHPVSAGDFFYIPANTVHAIGAGISLIEVQQNSDITYRLYDYGRPRELHLDDGVAVANGGIYPGDCHRQLRGDEPANLVEGPLFRLDQFRGPLSAEVAARYAAGPLLVIPRTDGVRIAGEAVASGGCGLALRTGEIELAPDAVGLIAQPVTA